MTGRAQLSYASRDYEALRRELLARIPRFTDRWTDFNASDLGVVLLELFCGVGDMLAYYLDVQANEAFLPTARQRQNVINLCKLVGYRLDGPVAATTELEFSLSQPRASALVVPAGTAARARLDDGEVWFETVEDVTIPGGTISARVGARQGRRRQETFEGSGEPGQSLLLAATAIAQDSIRVLVQGAPWIEARHFQDSDADSPHFLVETDALDRTRVVFGDGRSGAIPPAGAAIAVSLLETLGEEGNLGAGLVAEVLPPADERVRLLPATVTNPVPATGGISRESIPHARAQAPAELRSLWKAVTREDHLALALGFPGVAKAQIVDINDCESLRYYQVNLAIAPNGGGLPSPLLKRDLLEFLESRKLVTIEVRIFDPEYRPVAVEGEIFVLPGEDADLVRSRAEAALAEHFAFDSRSFGQGVFVSDLMALLDGVRGVSHVELLAPQRDVTLRPGQIAALGEVSLVMKGAVA
jgi:hypothetical protein